MQLFQKFVNDFYKTFTKSNIMPRKKPHKKGKHKAVGIEAVVEPGIDALYIRGAWMKKLGELGKQKPKRIKRIKNPIANLNSKSFRIDASSYVKVKYFPSHF